MFHGPHSRRTPYDSVRATHAYVTSMAHDDLIRTAFQCPIPLQELHRRDDVFFPERKLDEDGTDVPRNDRSGSTSSTSSFDTGLEEGAEARMYSGQEMKKAYYEAFWRARSDAMILCPINPLFPVRSHTLSVVRSNQP